MQHWGTPAGHVVMLVIRVWDLIVSSELLSLISLGVGMAGAGDQHSNIRVGDHITTWSSL